MPILAIDTTNDFCRTAISSKQNLFACISKKVNYAHAENIINIIHELLKSSAVNKKYITSITVACGPGSFTGIRTGIATAKGLGLALNIPIIGINNFTLYKNNIQQKYNLNQNDKIIIILESKRQDFYSTIIQKQNNSSKTILNPTTLTQQQITNLILKQNVKYISGNATQRFLEANNSNPKININHIPMQNFSMRSLTQITQNIINLKNIKQFPPNPIYLKPPQTSKPKKI